MPKYDNSQMGEEERKQKGGSFCKESPELRVLNLGSSFCHGLIFLMSLGETFICDCPASLPYTVALWRQSAEQSARPLYKQ